MLRRMSAGCAWMQGAPCGRGGARFCGERTVDGVWCAAHRAIVHGGAPGEATRHNRVKERSATTMSDETEHQAISTEEVAASLHHIAAINELAQTLRGHLGAARLVQREVYACADAGDGYQGVDMTMIVAGFLGMAQRHGQADAVRHVTHMAMALGALDEHELAPPAGSGTA